LKWLRQHIGVVSQEPILFHTTIRENILFGCDSSTDEQIHYAAKMANAHDFIMTLPDVRMTFVCFVFHDFFYRNMKLKWVNVEPHYQVDKNKELVNENITYT
jgi:ABC-type multidrug transport system fused ATPase/permease subunit